MQDFCICSHFRDLSSMKQSHLRVFFPKKRVSLSWIFRRSTLFLLLILVLLGLKGREFSLFASNRLSGDGLLTTKCGMEYFQKMVITTDPLTGEADTSYVTDSIFVCRVVPIGDTLKITYCDTVSSVLSMVIDSSYVETKTEFVAGRMNSVDVYLYDTLVSYQYTIKCFLVDTSYKYDTVYKDYGVVSIDTTTVFDTFYLDSPEYVSKTSMLFCPHGTSSYSPYQGYSSKFADSIKYYTDKLNELLSTWPDGVRVVSSLEEQVKEIVDDILVHYPDSIVDTSYIIDSIESIIPITPEHYRSKIEMFLAAQQRYADSVVHIQEYHIDSVNVVADLHMKGGAVMTDTFTVRTIPLFYELMPDTSVQFEKSLPIWAGSPRLPWNDADTYVELTWFPPVDAVTRKVVKPRQGFDADGLVEYGDVSLTDSVHIKALIRQGGINNFLAWAPIYTADTADGDSLLFPIRIKATKALMDHYPNAPEESCEYVDTVKVRIVKGYRVSGYVSYAGLWKPSEIGDTKSPDAPQYDGDLVAGGRISHQPIANVSIYLKSLDNGVIVDSAVSGIDGYFTFEGYYLRGKYEITGSSPQKVVRTGTIGVSGNDATWVQNFVIGAISSDQLPSKTNPDLSMWWYASNVDLSLTPYPTQGLDGNDATYIQNKVVGQLNNSNEYLSYDGKKLDDWAYSIDTLDLNADTMFHVRGVMRGDADRNYDKNTDPFQEWAKSSFLSRKRKLRIPSYGYLNVDAQEKVIAYPVLSLDSGFVSGFQIFLYYDEDRIEPLKASMPSILDVNKSNLAYNVIDGQIRTTWVSSQKTFFKEGDTLLLLHLKIIGKHKKNMPSLFSNDAFQYTVSDTLARIISWEVSMPDLNLGSASSKDSVHWSYQISDGDTVYELPENETPLAITGSPENEQSHILNVVPNPISAWGDVTYFVSGNCLVNLKLYSLLGENVLTFVDGERQEGLYRLSMDVQTLPSGVYVLRLETSKDGQTEFDIAKIIIKR